MGWTNNQQLKKQKLQYYNFTIFTGLLQINDFPPTNQLEFEKCLSTPYELEPIFSYHWMFLSCCFNCSDDLKFYVRRWCRSGIDKLQTNQQALLRFIASTEIMIMPLTILLVFRWDLAKLIFTDCVAKQTGFRRRRHQNLTQESRQEVAFLWNY